MDDPHDPSPPEQASPSPPTMGIPDDRRMRPVRPVRARLMRTVTTVRFSRTGTMPAGRLMPAMRLVHSRPVPAMPAVGLICSRLLPTMATVGLTGSGAMAAMTSCSVDRLMQHRGTMNRATHRRPANDRPANRSPQDRPANDRPVNGSPHGGKQNAPHTSWRSSLRIRIESSGEYAGRSHCQNTERRRRQALHSFLLIPRGVERDARRALRIACQTPRLLQKRLYDPEKR
jgi:hypothetical protein